jgi:hypothetical protein
MRSKYLKMAVVVIFVIGVVAGNDLAKDANKPAAASKTTKKTDKSAVSKSEKKTDKSAASSKSKPAAKDYKGTIKVTKNKDGKIKAVDLKVGSVIKSIYHITLDEMGKELGTKMSGDKVTATGTIEKKKGAKWLTVTKYSREKTKAENEPKKSNTETKKETNNKKETTKK